MSEQRFQVLFSGQVAEGWTLEQTREQLESLAVLSPSEAQHAFDGTPVVLKSSLNESQAQRYESALIAAGAVCQLVPREVESPRPANPPLPGPIPIPSEAPPPPPIPTPDPPQEPAAFVVPAPPPAERTRFSPQATTKQMTCPQCGFDQDAADECFQCGVLVEKFLERTRLQAEEKMLLAKDGIYLGADDDEVAGGNDFFAPEKKGIEKGMMGGIAMMVLAAVWFFGGYAMGIIFFYPPVLFLFGLFAFAKGLFTGNVAG
ncbi:MAG: hypothetical protein WBG93_05195 [Thermoanaerobaculia bacterium]